MTNLITLTIPNDDHIALRVFGKALEEMALAHGAEPRKTTVGELSYKLNIDTTEATAALERLRAATEELLMTEPEIDTTAQQVESLAVPMGDNEEQTPPTTDSTGTPWDERIHSTSKALNADGTWRLRRKPKDMDEMEWSALVESVKAELIDKENKDFEEWEKTKQPDYLPEPPVTLEDAVNASIEATHTGIAQEFGTGIANAAFTGDRNKPPVTPSGGEEQEALDAIRKATDDLSNGIPIAEAVAPLAQFEPPVTPPGDDFHTDTGVVTEQTVAGIPPLPVPPPVVVAPPHTSDVGVLLMRTEADAQPTWDFPRLMTFLTERHGKIDVATVNTLLAQDGLASLQELNAHPDKIGPFVARVKAHLGE